MADEMRPEEVLLATLERFVKVSWCVEDLCSTYDMSPAEALAFLRKYERPLQDIMVVAGWEALDVLTAAEGYERYTEDEAPEPPVGDANE